MRLDVVVQLHDAGLFGKERRTEFFESPSEIVAVVIEGIVSILAGVEAAVFLVGQTSFTQPMMPSAVSRRRGFCVACQTWR